MDSNNFDHQQYYAGRALEALEKTEALAESCGCNESLSVIKEGILNLEKALDPRDWEMGRYYKKKALANAQNLLSALDLCSGTDSYEAENEKVESEEINDINTATTKLPEELEEQLALKNLKEITLSELENTLKSLASILGCDKAKMVLENRGLKTEDTLNDETLEATKDYYFKQTIALQTRALNE